MLVTITTPSIRIRKTYLGENVVKEKEYLSAIFSLYSFFNSNKLVLLSQSLCPMLPSDETPFLK